MSLAMATTFHSHDDYFAAQAPEQRDRLVQIQRTVDAVVPGAQHIISYNMPAFRAGRIFFYVATFRHHIGIYPPVTADASVIAATARYCGPKGNLRFPHDEPLPMDVIARVAAALAAQYASR